jgi:Tol biopolymer transport system component/DNA-binding winged helix-turn-helix (wHTH) protein
MKEVVGASQSSTTPPAEGVFRFGQFEVDTRSGELRRGGIKVKLSGQPFDVLLALLEKPGQVVTREELHDKLWSQDTFVDFEQGLNKAINKVREALGDDADNPRYIETLPRRGYRFLAPVITPTSIGTAAPAEIRPVPLQVASSTQSKFPRKWISGVALAAIVAGAIVEELRPTPPKVLRYTQLTNDGLKKNASLDAELATDGSRVYFWEQDGQQGLIAQVSATGGNVSTVAKFQNVRFSTLDYSAVRSELLFSFDYLTPLWALRVPEGSGRRRIGDLVVDDAAWSPDGRSIAIATMNQLVAVNADGTQPRVLVRMPGTDIVARPRWSPDGKLLRFTSSSPDGRNSMWQVATDGSGLHPVFSDWKTRNDYVGSWTPDGRYFVYTSVLPNGHGSIFAIRNGKGVLRSDKAVELTPGPMSFSAPVASTDGKGIFALGSLDQGEVVRYDRSTQKWLPYLSGISAAGLDFSRDGEWVTYVLVPDGTLWRSRVDGSEQLQLTIPPMRTALPRWSPDGRQIVFSAWRPGGTLTIYRISADGGDPQQLVPEAEIYQDPTWAPDGKRVVFGEGVMLPQAIHIVDVQSHQVSDVPGSKGFFSPRWSPDGRFIVANTAVIGFPQGTQKLMIFDVSTQKWQEWSDESRSGFNDPIFSHDSKYVYFSDVEAATIYRLRLGEKKPEVVAKIDAPGGMKMTDFWYWSGLAPDGSPMFLRDTSAREIYALDVDFP